MKVSKIVVEERLHENSPWHFTSRREIDISEIEMPDAIRVFQFELLKIYAHASGECKTPKRLVAMRSSFYSKNLRTEIRGWGSVEFAAVGRYGQLITF